MWAWWSRKEPKKYIAITILEKDKRKREDRKGGRSTWCESTSSSSTWFGKYISWMKGTTPMHQCKWGWMASPETLQRWLTSGLCLCHSQQIRNMESPTHPYPLLFCFVLLNLRTSKLYLISSNLNPYLLTLLQSKTKLHMYVCPPRWVPSLSLLVGSSMF